MSTYSFTLKQLFQVVSKNILMFLDTTCLGGYREGETPGPIPNPEAKPLFADNTYPFRIGNVGRCLVGCFYFIFALLKFIYILYLPKRHDNTLHNFYKYNCFVKTVVKSFLFFTYLFVYIPTSSIGTR